MHHFFKTWAGEFGNKFLNVCINSFQIAQLNIGFKTMNKLFNCFRCKIDIPLQTDFFKLGRDKVFLRA